MCCFHMGIALKRVRCKGLPGWFGALFFSTFARFTERGGGLKLIRQFPYRTNTFQKGAFLNETRGSDWSWTPLP